MKAVPRIIASGNMDLVQRAQHETSLEQLYHRLNVLHLQVPPLRERPDDVPELVRFYADWFPVGYFVFQLPVKGSLILLFGETILFISLALALGIMISTMSSSQQVAMFISAFALMLPTMLLSGFIFPIENMPVILQWLCKIMPPKYFIYILRNIMLKGTGLMEVWKETLVLTGMLVLFLSISAIRFKERLPQKV